MIRNLRSKPHALLKKFSAYVAVKSQTVLLALKNFSLFLGIVFAVYLLKKLM